ncbi:MAG: adhesive domain-containing protein [Christensenellaceae bacterium]
MGNKKRNTKKKRTFRFISLLVAVLLLASVLPMTAMAEEAELPVAEEAVPAAAEGEDGGAEIVEIEVENEGVVAVDDAITSEIDDAITENTEALFAAQAQEDTMQTQEEEFEVLATALSATLTTPGGVVAFEGSNNATVDVAASVNVGNKLTVKADFDSDKLEKTVTIKLEPGMRFTRIPGMIASNSELTDWVEDTTPNAASNPFPSNYAGGMVGPPVFTRADKLTSYGDYQPRAGTLVYTFNKDTMGVLIEVDIGLDPSFAITEHDANGSGVVNQNTFENPVTVTAAQGGVGIGTGVKLPKYTFGGRVSPRLSGGMNYFKKVGEAVAPRYRMYIYDEGTNGSPTGRFSANTRQMMFDSITYTIRYNKDYFLPDSTNPIARPASHATYGVNNSLSDEAILAANASVKVNDPTLHVGSEYDQSTYNYITVTFPYFKTADVYNSTTIYPYFCINGTVQDPTVAANEQKSTPIHDDSTLMSSELTLYNSTKLNRARYAVDGGTLFVLGSGAGGLSFRNLSAPYVSEYLTDTPLDVVGLGGFSVGNYSDTVTPDHQMRIDFSAGDGVYGVRAVKLMTQASTALVPIPDPGLKITIRTNKGGPYDTYQKPESNWPVYTIDQLKGTSAPALDGEYITYIEYEMGDIPSGLMTHSYGMRDTTLGGIFYYGDLLNVPTTGSGSDGNGEYTQYSATAEFYTASAPGNKDYTVQGPPKTENINVYSHKNGTIPKSVTYSVAGSGNQGSGVSLLAGKATTTPITASINTGSHNYVTNPNVHFVEAYDDIVVYLRDTADLKIKKDSIQYSLEGNKAANYIDAESLVQEKEVNGNTVYYFTIPGAVTGGYIYSPTGISRRTAPYIRFNVAAEFSAQSQTIPLSDLILVTVNSANAPLAYPSTSSIKDADDVTGNGVDYRVGAATGSFRTQENKSFIVSSGSGYGDGVWGVYEPGNPGTRIRLNPAGEAWYQTQIVNNSQATVPGGYKMMIPIHKEGEIVSSDPLIVKYMQDGAFGFSLYVTEDIRAQMVRNGVIDETDDLEVFYSTNKPEYTLSKDATSEWKTWDEVKNNADEIRCVMFSSSKDMEHEYKKELYFSLGLPERTTCLGLQGAINTFSSRIYRDVGGNKTYAYSERVSVTLNVHVIEGTVLVKRTGDPVGGVSIKALDCKASDKQLETVTSNSNGEYYTLSLLKYNDGAYTDPFVKLEITNPRPVVNGEVKKDSLRFSAGQKLDIVSDHSKATTTVDLNPDIPGQGTDNIFHVKMDAPHEVVFDDNLPAVRTQATVAPVYQFAGETIASPSVTPDHHGYTFKGWYKSKAGAAALDASDLWSFSTDTVPSDMTLFAGWQSFAAPTINLAEDEITLNTNPEKNGGVSLKDYTEEMFLKAIGATVSSNIPGGGTPVISTNFDSIKPADGFKLGDSPYTITVTATDSAGNKSVITVTVNIVDDTPPTITSPGGGKLTIKTPVGTKLTEEDIDKLITSQYGQLGGNDDSSGVTVKYDLSGVDFNKPGTYTAWAYAIDSSGNISDKIEIEIIVEGSYAAQQGIAPKTGDSAMLTLWIALVAIGALCIGAVTLLLRRRTQG